MHEATQLGARFKSEQFEIIDFIPVFMQWSRQVSPEISKAIPSYSGPITIRFLIESLLIAIGIELALQSYMHYVRGDPIMVIQALVGLVFALSWVLGIRIFNNWRVRKYAIKRASDIIQTVLPKGSRVSPARKDRIRRVSPWFAPVAEFQSLEPGIKGLIVAVMSPMGTKLFFVRDNSAV